MIERIITYTLFLVMGFLSGCASSPDTHFQKVEKAAAAPAEEALNYLLECNGTGVDPLQLKIER